MGGDYKIHAAMTFYNYTNMYKNYGSRPATLRRLEEDKSYRKEFAEGVMFEEIEGSPAVVSLSGTKVHILMMMYCTD